MNNYEWYQQLIRPSWAPPSWLFGPVWTVLYILIGISFGTVFYRIAKKRLPLKFGVPFGLNLVFNFLFTPIQFGLKSNILAAVDISFVFITLLWALLAIGSQIKWVALISIPYMCWVTFALILQFTVTILNM